MVSHRYYGSLTYTTKCAIPLLTAMLSFLIDGPSSLPNMAALLSLVPIAFGIAAASWKSPELDRLGLLAAITSATAQSALNVSSKRVMRATKISGPSAQRVMVAVGLMMTVAMMFAEKRIAEGDNEERPMWEAALPPRWISFAAMTAYHLEYVLSFVFVGLTSPVTYGTCDAIRRLGIILSGRALFGGSPLSDANKFGIATALAGAAAYSMATTW